MTQEAITQVRDSSPVDDLSGSSTPTVDGVITTPTPTVTPEATPSIDWDSPSNPYKYSATESLKELSALRQKQFESELRQWQGQLSQEGYTPAQVQDMTQQAAQAYQLQQYEQQLDTKARPIAAYELSRRIEDSMGVKISPDELLKTSQGGEIASVEAMLARADALVSERRKAGFDKRKKDGADNTGDTLTTVAMTEDRLKKMRPSQLIQEGLKRRGDI